MNVATIQTSLFWEDVDKNLKMFSEKINQIESYVDLIILPEMFTTGFTNNTAIIQKEDNQKTIVFLKNIVKEKACAVCGSFIFKEGEKFYNRLFWIDETQTKHYDKKHLFSYAKEQNYFEAGKEKLIVDYKGWKILPLICYDLRFPVWSKRTKNENYDLLIYVANWPERRNFAWQQLLIARAIENQSYTIGLNRVGHDGNEIYYSGDSAIIDFMGENITKNAHEEIILTANLDKEQQDNFRKTFTALEDDDLFTIH